MARPGDKGGPQDSQLSSREDRALCELLDRMVPTLKRAIMRDSERRPDSMNLEIVLLSSILQVRKDLCA